jgi:LPXTG-motif cell wall-anchored protein
LHRQKNIERERRETMRQIGLLIVMLMLLLSIAQPAAAQGPTLSVVTPKSGESIDGSTVSVSFTTSNIKLVPTSIPVAEAGKRPEANHPGEGHLHFVLDLQPLVVWESGDPYTFSGVPAGEHQLMVELVNNDHSPLSPPVMQQIQFRSGMPRGLPVTGDDSMSDAGMVGALLISSLLVIAGSMLVRPRRRVKQS